MHLSINRLEQLRQSKLKSLLRAAEDYFDPKYLTKHICQLKTIKFVPITVIVLKMKTSMQAPITPGNCKIDITNNYD